MKKKYLMRLSILCFLFLFVCCGCTFASWSTGEFELKVSQVYNIAKTYHSSLSTMFTAFLSSNAYSQTKDSIPFDDYDYMLVSYNSSVFGIYLTNNNPSAYIDSSGNLMVNSTWNFGYAITYSVDTRYWSFAVRSGFPVDNYDYGLNNNYWNVDPQKTGNKYFALPFVTSTITNQYTYTIYGYNFTATTPVYNGTTNVDVGEYYRLCRGFIGSYYYGNYEDLEYKIVRNDSSEYIGTKNIYYTPDINGQVVDIYFYIESSMSQYGYKVDLYFDDVLLYSENSFNTLIVNRWFIFWR